MRDRLAEVSKRANGCFSALQEAHAMLAQALPPVQAQAVSALLQDAAVETEAILDLCGEQEDYAGGEGAQSSDQLATISW